MKQYFAILGEAKASQDIVEAQKALNDMTVDIESKSGQLSLMRHQSVYSSVKITFGARDKQTISRAKKGAKKETTIKEVF